MTRKKTTRKKTPARKAPPRVARKAPSGAEKARAAGAQYANDQVSSDYFADWVWDQLREASRMDPSTVLPLETEADARVIAKNMLQQLEWDTRRDLRASEIERLVGGGLTSPSCIDAFFDGFQSQLHESLDWLAEHVLEQGQEIQQTATISRRLTDQQTKIDNRMGRAAPRRFMSAPRRSDGRQKYRPAKTWRLRKVERIVPSAGAHRVEFNDDLSIQVHRGHGRNDLLYAMKPSDMRHENRSPGPESRREYQYAALLAVLNGKEAEFFLDREGDVIAVMPESTWSQMSEAHHEEAPHPALIEALAADVNALRQERRISFEEAYDAITKPDWVRQYRGNKIDLENRIINKAKSIGRARGRISETRRRPVARGTARNRR